MKSGISIDWEWTEPPKKTAAEKCNVICMNLKAVEVQPNIQVNALNNKMKHTCYNYVVYKLALHPCTCCWFSEVDSDLEACR